MNILLTSVGRRSYMVHYFKEALEGNGIVHAANSVETYAMKIADKSVLTPLIYDNDYIEFLLEYCFKNNISVIIPLFDIDLLVLAKNKNKFVENNIIVIVSDIDFVKICNDKWLTYTFLTKNGFKAPLSFLSINEALQAIERRKINFPLITKPRWGMGSIGIFQADNKEELGILYNKTLKTINESYLKYESQQSPEESVIIQEKLVGVEYGIDIFNNLNGEILACVPKKKLEMRAGETFSAEIIEDKKLLKIGEKLSQLTKHIGNLDVDFVLMKNKFYILEMNCRFGGQYPFSHLAGVNFPKAIIKMLKGEKFDQTILHAKTGIIGIKDLVPVIFEK